MPSWKGSWRNGKGKMAGFEKQENHPCIRMRMLLPDRPGFDILNAETGIIIPKGSGIMNCCADEKTLTVGVEGRLDAACSDETEKEIRECIRLHPGPSLCLDLDKLEYISSSGIRVLLKFQKELPELAHKLQRNGFVGSRHGEHEVNVRMNELLNARIAAIYLFQKVHHQGKSAAAVILVKEHGVRNVPALHHLVQGVYHFRISINFHRFFTSF